MSKVASAGYYFLMLTERLIDLLERSFNFTFSSHAIRRISLLVRLLLIFTFTVVLFRLAPTMADELTPSPDIEIASTPSSDSQEPSTTSPEPQSSQNHIPVPVPTEEPIAPVPSSSPSPSTSSTPPPPIAIANQIMQLRVPSSLLVDPRARTAGISELFIAGPQHLLVCISGTSTLADVYLKNFADADFGGQTLVSGDRTSNVRITGTVDQVLAILNSAQGMRVTSPFGTLGGQNIIFRFIATSAPTLESSLCAKAWPSNTRTLTFRAMGIEIEMKKGDIILKK